MPDQTVVFIVRNDQKKLFCPLGFPLKPSFFTSSSLMMNSRACSDIFHHHLPIQLHVCALLLRLQLGLRLGLRLHYLPFHLQHPLTLRHRKISRHLLQQVHLTRPLFLKIKWNERVFQLMHCTLGRWIKKINVGIEHR